MEENTIKYTTQETSLVRLCDKRQIEKKILPEYFEGIRSHKKMFEIRKDEDGIKPGDILILREWDGKKYTGNQTRREVTAVLKDCPEEGLLPGYCVLSLQVPGWEYTRTQATLDNEENELPGDDDAIVSALRTLYEDTENGAAGETTLGWNRAITACIHKIESMIQENDPEN